jgi:hypothetical protein
VREFFAWRRGQSPAEALIDGLRRWEQKRFGAELDPAPHGALWYALRWALAPSDGGRHHPPSYERETSWHQRRRELIQSGRLDAELKAMLKGRAGAGAVLGDMPRARPSKREWEMRLQELKAQANALGGDAASRPAAMSEEQWEERMRALREQIARLDADAPETQARLDELHAQAQGMREP